jgi:GntR family transcriptional repressor for pyruvate dehydrogenase complex
MYTIPMSTPDLSNKMLKRPKNLSVQLAQDLRDRVARAELKPGDKLPSEQALMISYGVSRTVVREAISSLKTDGLVETQQGVGAFVQQPTRGAAFRIDQSDLNTVKEVLSLLELRISLEAEAAALAAGRISDEQLASLREALELMTRSIEAEDDAVEPDFQFHMEVAKATGNHYYADLFGYLGTLAIPRTRVDTFRSNPAGRRAYLQNVNQEHFAIFQAIANHDPDAARAAMRLHLTNSRERLRRAYENAAQSR